MATLDITATDFAETVQGNDIVFIDFWAAWCGPCRQFAPVYEDISNENTDIVFAKVDTEAETELARDFQITSIPTLMAIREGVVLYSQPGALRKNDLEQLVQAVRDVNMEEVHQEIAQESNK